MLLVDHYYVHMRIICCGESPQRNKTTTTSPSMSRYCPYQQRRQSHNKRRRKYWRMHRAKRIIKRPSIVKAILLSHSDISLSVSLIQVY
jgi:hypothetical protein